MKQLRLRSKKRAEEVAAELGVAISTVRNWEQHKNVPRMTPKGLQKLMEIYNCTFEELIQAEAELEADSKTQVPSVENTLTAGGAR